MANLLLRYISDRAGEWWKELLMVYGGFISKSGLGGMRRTCEFKTLF